MYKIYMHTSPSGKRYIGITKQDLDKRFRGGSGYERCTLFCRAISKYGWDNIKHEVIDVCETLEEANMLETKYISLYKTNDMKYGYNCTEGGDGVKGYKFSEEQRIENSKKMKALWEDDQFRDKLTKERKARGKTDDERERLRNMLNQNWSNPEMRSLLEDHLREISRDKDLREIRSQKMKEIWNNSPERYKKALDALEKVRNDPEHKEKQKEKMKKHWKENREVFLKNRVAKCGAENPMAKAVICVETGIEYCTAREAEAKTGVSYKCISLCIRGKHKTAGGLHWVESRKYKEDKNE